MYIHVHTHHHHPNQVKQESNTVTPIHEKKKGAIADSFSKLLNLQTLKRTAYTEMHTAREKGGFHPAWHIINQKKNSQQEFVSSLLSDSSQLSRPSLSFLAPLCTYNCITPYVVQSQDKSDESHVLDMNPYRPHTSLPLPSQGSLFCPPDSLSPPPPPPTPQPPLSPPPHDHHQRTSPPSHVPLHIFPISQHGMPRNTGRRGRKKNPPLTSQSIRMHLHATIYHP